MARVRREYLPSAVSSDAVKAQPLANRGDAEDSDRPTTTRRRRVRRISSDELSAGEPEAPRKSVSQSSVLKSRSRIRLAPLQSLPSTNSLTVQDDREGNGTRSRQRSSQPKPSSTQSQLSEETLSLPLQVEEEAEETDVEQSIWCGSIDEPEDSSDDELPSPQKWLRLPARGMDRPPKLPTGRPMPNLSKQFEALRMFDYEDQAVPVQKPALDDDRKVRDSTDKEHEYVRLSPARLLSPRKKDPVERPSTSPPPPASPSKLKSPSKRIGGPIPAQPFRPSLDAFWTVGAVNDWNDQYSPQKPLKSPRKLKLQPNDEPGTPTTSQAKRNSPTRRTKAELEIRKDFESRKHALAKCFLSELDLTVTSGKVAQLSASTGGVQLLWSKTLNSTAGRANWRRESAISKCRDGTITTTHKHHASIELASKVIDDEHRLLNVIAHEFCHLANFMISGIKNQPHGTSFKQWGRKCTEAFRERGVEVTTKHTYEIEYKYIWQCADEFCGVEFKRHSKSIDPARHQCGKCKTELVQVKPVPRRGNAGKGSGGTETPVLGGGKTPAPVTGYAAFVKENFAALKKAMPGVPHREVMQALGQKWTARESKTDFGSLADALAKDLDAMKLGGGKGKEIIDLD
ncbi:hypothetical protein DOTSEDRAFT_56306 [Dothistroma septosporum NZE10]|uniref:SprT-like domain-containing protein n=1 Tax=Dothistroma septosporum (strain NZE10 / CBS 128990) TaxID=675120 RepID=N1PD25_DOTSN|nr:hypothetical protein DOTSEDRAFT_56306 [Dothistroma septosporum NZE10]